MLYYVKMLHLLIIYSYRYVLFIDTSLFWIRLSKVKRLYLPYFVILRYFRSIGTKCSARLMMTPKSYVTCSYKKGNKLPGESVLFYLYAVADLII